MIKDGELHTINHEMDIVGMWVDVREHLLNVTQVIDHMAERIYDLSQASIVLLVPRPEATQLSHMLVPRICR